MSVLVAPSILSADFGNLQRDIRMINESRADWFHVDVMDGVFVPNISFGFPVMNATVEVMEQILVAVNIVEEQVPEIEHSKIFYLVETITKVSELLKS